MSVFLVLSALSLITLTYCQLEEGNGCPAIECEIMCDNGFKADINGCEICECNNGPCDCQDDEECIINSNLEWECEKKLNGNETCEWEDGGSERERSGSRSRSKSYSKSGSKSKSATVGKSGEATHTGRGRSDTRNGTPRNQTATLSSLPEHILLLLSSRSGRVEEEEELYRIRGSSVGAASRNVLRNILTFSDSCRPGFYCKKTSRTHGVCSPVNEDRPCYSASADAERDCDDNGFYKPRICEENDNGDWECVCVLPENGTTIEDTRVTIREEDDEDSEEIYCRDRVYGSCSITYGGVRYSVKHGRRHFDYCNCRECVCYFGQLYCDETQTSCRIRCSNNTRTCTLEDGSVLAHGESIESDCNRCACQNGQLICSRYKCTTNDATTDEDVCERCSSERINRVCGPDRRTYPNTCAAVNCFGWDSSDVLQGHCNSHNPCVQFPCEKGEICLRRGGVSCLAQGGCNPSDVRICVNVTRLPCNFMAKLTEEEDSSDDGALGSGDIEPSDTAVCGRDGKSYPTICHIIPQYTSVHVLHAGQCNNRNCRGGEVCGTDGVTYENICVLRSLSANARVDYRGGCIDINGTVDEYCQAVLGQGLCPYTSENCNNLVRPSSGCCPICGSAITILIDIEQLQDAASVISSLRTLDDLTANLLEADFFSVVYGRCKVESTSTNNGIELIFSSILSEDNEFCIAKAQNIVEQINSFTSGSSGRKRQVDDDADNLPSSYQYIVGAVSAPGADSNASEGGASTAVASTIILMIMIIITLVLY